jgi:hypothetical protein
MELLLCLTDPFLGLSKVLICGPSRDPSSGPPLCSQSQAHLLIRGCCPREVAHNLKGTVSGSISVGQGEKRSMGGQKIENRVWD